MKLTIEKDYESMSRHAARHVTELVIRKPDALICIAAGDTPKLMCKFIADTAAEKKIDFSKCYFVSLDEWVGISPQNEGSCQYFLRNNLFDPLDIPESNVRLFNPLANDLRDECVRMDEYIQSHGGIDLIVVGIGRNGHIGFNEPGVPFGKYAHVVALDETTQTVGQKYFREKTTLTKGITLGLQHLLDARRAILIANGTNKAAVIKQAIEGVVDPRMPASVIRNHQDAEVILDSDAASQLTPPNEHK